MNHAIVRIFDDYDQAQRAREALLAEGFAADGVTIRIANDEAGAVDGTSPLAIRIPDAKITATKAVTRTRSR